MALVLFSGCAPVAGATITVRLAGTITDADIYADEDETPLGNPFSADAETGLFTFWSAEGVDLDIVVNTGGADPSLRVPDANLYAIASGASPARVMSLVADDDGAQVVIAQSDPY